MPTIAPPVVAVALAFLWPIATAAPEASPPALPTTPEPSECRVEPRPRSFVDDAIARAVASPAPVPTFPPGGSGRTITPTPIPFSEEGSRPADAATVAAATATVREVFACINAGDMPRFLALLTDQAARDNVAFLVSGPVNRGLAAGTPRAALATEIGGESRAFFSASPEALPVEERAGPVAVANARLLADDRVVVDFVTAGSGGARTGEAVLVDDGGRLRIAGITLSSPQETPTASPTLGGTKPPPGSPPGDGFAR